MPGGTVRKRNPAAIKGALERRRELREARASSAERQNDDGNQGSNSIEHTVSFSCQFSFCSEIYKSQTMILN
jgi:hypothetical protein